LVVRHATIRSVRVGGVVIRDVKAIVLPPEGEDLGVKLGRDALVAHRVDVDGLRLRLTVTPVK
jgi:hypothetical protein